MLTLLAQDTTTTTGCDPGSGAINLGDCYVLNRETGTTVSSVYQQPADLVNVLIRNIFVVGGVILFGSLLFAGFKFIQSGSKGKEEAKTIVKTAAIGFIVMFAAFWIVRIIQVIIGQNLIQ